MSRVHIVVEGQTEESFVRNVLVPYFALRGIYVTNTIVRTKRIADGPDYVGGMLSYGKFKFDVERALNNPSLDMVTTLIDFYGLPLRFPGRNSVPPGSSQTKVQHVEAAIDADIGNERFRSYVAMHEFEALLFAGPDVIQEAFPEKACEVRIQQIRDQFDSPEDINDSPHTAPSKRLETIFGNGYQKTVHGPLITETIGLAKLRAECTHFDEWITCMEGL